MSYKKEKKGSEIFCNAIENSVNVFKDVLVQNKIENPEKYEEQRNTNDSYEQDHVPLLDLKICKIEKNVVKFTIYSSLCTTINKRFFN